MIDNQTISAVLFVYNEEKYIAEMLDSINRQQHHIDEIIIVDDQSTDGTKDIVAARQSKDSRIRYFLNPAKGKIFAYQLGLASVKTDLFFVCAGDDVLMPDFVGYLYRELMVRFRLDFCYASCVITDAALNIISSPQGKLFYTTDELLSRNFMNGYLFGSHSIIPKIVPLPDTLQFEDWYTAIKLSVLYGKCYRSEKPLFHYRHHGQNATSISRSRSKYLGSVHRNLRLYHALLASRLLTEAQAKRVRSIVRYHELLADFSFGRAIRLLTEPHLSWKQKFKVFINPAWLSIYYSRP